MASVCKLIHSDLIRESECKRLCVCKSVCVCSDNYCYIACTTMSLQCVCLGCIQEEELVR